MKRFFLFLLLAAAGILPDLCAGECKYCGCNTDGCAVFRCGKCRKFFCEKCREGDGKKETGDFAAQQAQKIFAELDALSGNPIQIICPECGTKDRMVYGRMQDGKIRIIKQP